MRPQRYDLLPLEEAARVSRFMSEAEVGRWRLRKFTVTDEEFRAKTFGASLNLNRKSPERVAMELARIVPPGAYISLQRQMTVAEAREDLSEWIETHESLTGQVLSDDEVMKIIREQDGATPVMSDTPAEIREHADAMDRAVGRVLINGLGMGVLVSALLAKSLVTHIDVVEVDPDVIDLVGPYYDDPRVTIHRGDAATIEWPANARWDYAWHDIWSNISDRNIDPDTAEHGIAYSTLFEKYDGLVGAQGAWAFPEAVEMQRLHFAERERLRRRAREYCDAGHDLRVAMYLTDIIRERTVGLSESDPIPDSVMEFWLEYEPGNGHPKLRDHAEEAITKAEEAGKFDSPAGFDAHFGSADTPLDRPNDFITR